jgi:hypothetical protein
MVEQGPSGDAVAVRDVESGKAVVGHLDEAPTFEVEVRADIPLDHKVALIKTKSGAGVIAYGVGTAIAYSGHRQGDDVHAYREERTVAHRAFRASRSFRSSCLLPH